MRCSRLAAVALFSALILVSCKGSAEVSAPAAPAIGAPEALTTLPPVASVTPIETVDSPETEATRTPTPAPVAQEPLPVTAATQLPDAEAQNTQTDTTVSEASPTQSEAQSTGRTHRPAPELVGIEGWINTSPLTLGDLRGKVVLVDFWTYTCVNCIRTFPFLREWDRKYRDSGLVILGVHTPEFIFEKSAANVKTAAQDYDLTYPIAQDNGYQTWEAFGTQAWPTKFVIDQDGFIRYVHRGEGAYEETESVLRELLEESGADLKGISPNTDPDPVVDPTATGDTVETSLTRELYAGYLRNVAGAGAYVINPEYYSSLNQVALYEDPDERLNHFMFVQGVWFNDPESLVHARETTDFEDYIGIQFFAKSVNAVINAEGETPFDVRITLDGMPLTEENKGADVVFDDEGNSFIVVDEPRMYRIVELPEFGGHELKLSPNAISFALHDFTFGAYSEGP